MRRALILLLIAILFVLFPARANAADKTISIGNGGQPSPKNVEVKGGESVTWSNDDPLLTEKHTLYIEGVFVAEIANGSSFTHTFDDPGASEVELPYAIDSANGPGGTITVQPATTTTTTEPTTTTTTTEPETTTTENTTTTSTSTTTTTSSTTTTSTTRPISSASEQVAIQDKGDPGGGSSALPLLLGAFVVVSGLAGLAYWLWLRSGEPYYEDEGPDWTQEPPPTVQGPSL